MLCPLQPGKQRLVYVLNGEEYETKPGQPLPPLPNLPERVMLRFLCPVCPEWHQVVYNLGTMETTDGESHPRT